MSTPPRRKTNAQTPAFDGEVEAVPREEEEGTPTALAMAIAEAARSAAAYLDKEGLDEADFEVSHIRITVRPNPGPTSYKVKVTPI